MALVMSQAKWIERSLYPYAVVSQTVPILALIPLLGFWFGFGLMSRVMVCVIIALFPIVINSLTGLQGVEPKLHDLVTPSQGKPLDPGLQAADPRSPATHIHRHEDFGGTGGNRSHSRRLPSSGGASLASGSCSTATAAA